MNLGGVAAMLLALLLLMWGLLLPVRVPVPEQARGSAGRDAATSGLDAAQRGPELDALQAVAMIDLRRPLRDPPPPVVVATPMQARFVGTIYQPAEPGQSLAIFSFPDSTQRSFKAGQQFDDPAGTVSVKQVGDRTVTIELSGEERELTATTP